MSMLDRLRTNVKAKKSTGGLDHTVFPFWNIPENGSAIIRLLPFEDSVSGGFWTVRDAMPMSFVDPEDESKLLTYRSPSLRMYDGGKCPIKALVGAVFNEAKDLKKNGDVALSETVNSVALSHWVKYTFYYQGFVIKAGFEETDASPSPVRIFPFSRQIHNLIESYVMDEDDPIDFLPTGEFTEDHVKAVIADTFDGDASIFTGRNLHLKKTKQGEYPTYTTSKWANDPSDLTDDQLTAIDEHGLHDLRARLPERPTEDQVKVLCDMMQVSLDFALGRGDGLWDASWEEAGITPYRERSSGSGSGSTDSGASVKDRLQSKMKGGAAKTDNAAPAAGSLKDQLSKKARGKTEAAPVADDVAEDTTDATDEAAPVEDTSTPAETKDTGKATQVSALAERLKAKAAKAATA